MITSFIRAQRTRIFWGVVLILVVVLGVNAWYSAIYTDPRRVFNAMIENSLTTSSVTKQITQGDDSQSLNQTTHLQVGDEHVVRGITFLSQKGLASAEVVTESIGTPTTDYVRYKSIDTDQKGTEGNELDFSEVVGAWGESPGAGQTTGELYNETTLGVIPFGNVHSSEQREALMRLVSDMDVYKVEYANVTEVTHNGRPVYEYTVKVLPEDYVTYLKAYASAVGLTHLQNVNPAQYANAEPIEFTVQVDVLSRRLAGIIYSNGRQEQYISYGGYVPVSKPAQTISVDELQNRIQSVQ